jgi:predicted lysophospholipase L1 biosynthesis ABC-type transport system permease subunit
MKTLLFGLLGLTLGATAGFWLGLMGGLIYAEAAKVPCFEGHCGYVAAYIAMTGAALCGLVGSVLGLRRGLKRRPADAAPSPSP